MIWKMQGFVRPTPPCSPLSDLHILLYQQIDSQHVGLIVTKYDKAVRQGAPFSAAVVCVNPPSRQPLLEVMGKTDVCNTPGVHCQVWREGRLIEDASHALDHGTNLQVHIYRQTLHSWDEPGDELDESVQMQHSLPQVNSQHLSTHASSNSVAIGENSCATFTFNADAIEFIPSQPPVDTLLEHMQDLHAMWDRHAFAWEGEVRKTSVQTWYLSPGSNQLRCGFCRKVHLFENYMQWEQAMINAWTDQITPNRPVFFFIVQPTPIALEHDAVAHILLVQEPTETQVSSLVTVF